SLCCQGSGHEGPWHRTVAGCVLDRHRGRAPGRAADAAVSRRCRDTICKDRWNEVAAHPYSFQRTGDRPRDAAAGLTPSAVEVTTVGGILVHRAARFLSLPS